MSGFSENKHNISFQMKQSLRIKFYCRSFNKELYMISRFLYEKTGYPCVRLTDQTADGYFYKMLEDETCDIAINVDEDCFIADMEAVMKLVEKAVEEGWINIGCSDAGPGVPRRGEAEVTNPFFNVFNLHEIRKQWNAYRLIPELKKDNYKGIEPYYNFFHWLNRTFPGRTLYLDNKKHYDRISTLLYDAEGHHLCSHSWFARQFRPSFLTLLFEGNDAKGVNHATRIDNLIQEVYTERGLSVPRLNLWQTIGCRIDEMVRWSIKVPQRIANWPSKIKARFGQQSKD